MLWKYGSCSKCSELDISPASHQEDLILNCLSLCFADELAIMLKDSGFQLEHAAGMTLELASGKWILSDDLAVNYIASFRPEGDVERATGGQLNQPLDIPQSGS